MLYDIVHFYSISQKIYADELENSLESQDTKTMVNKFYSSISNISQKTFIKYPPFCSTLICDPNAAQVCGKKLV